MCEEIKSLANCYVPTFRVRVIVTKICSGCRLFSARDVWEANGMHRFFFMTSHMIKTHLNLEVKIFTKLLTVHNL